MTGAGTDTDTGTSPGTDTGAEADATSGSSPDVAAATARGNPADAAAGGGAQQSGDSGGAQWRDSGGGGGVDDARPHPCGSKRKRARSQLSETNRTTADDARSGAPSPSRAANRSPAGGTARPGDTWQIVEIAARHGLLVVEAPLASIETLAQPHHQRERGSRPARGTTGGGEPPDTTTGDGNISFSYRSVGFRGTATAFKTSNARVHVLQRAPQSVPAPTRAGAVRPQLEPPAFTMDISFFADPSLGFDEATFLRHATELGSRAGVDLTPSPLADQYVDPSTGQRAVKYRLEMVAQAHTAFPRASASLLMEQVLAMGGCMTGAELRGKSRGLAPPPVGSGGAEEPG